MHFGGKFKMIELKLEVIRFHNEDVIATSGAFELTSGETYVTLYDEYIESGNVYNYSYDFLRFKYAPGEEDHMAIYGAFGSSSTVSNKYTYAWYDSGSSNWYTENKTKGTYGGNYPTEGN